MTEVPGDLGRRARFEALVVATELPLRRALVAAYGGELGRDATADALAWAWEHLDVVEGLENPAGYLFRVGQTAARRAGGWWPRRRLWMASEPFDPVEDWAFEPGLLGAMQRLSPQQRAAVMLVHGWGHTLESTADALGCGVSTVRNHLRRGLTKLRVELGVESDD